MEDKGLYSRALTALREQWLPMQKGKTFTNDDVYRFFKLDRLGDVEGYTSAEYKKAFGDALYNITHVNKVATLEQTGNRYRLIDSTLREIKWWDGDAQPPFELVWPYGVEDESGFGFEDSIILTEGDIIGLSGEGNRGKTTFCLNITVNNCDKYECVYFTSEFNDVKFRRRIAKFDWVDIWKPDGTPKFRLAKQEQNFQDVIVPDAINIIDWIRLDDEPWKINQIMDKIQSKLGKGICIVSLQKRTYKSHAVGGEGSMDYASAYFTLYHDKNLMSDVLKVEKVKEPGNSNPNFKKFKFMIVEGGSRFHGIEEIKEG